MASMGSRARETLYAVVGMVSNPARRGLSPKASRWGKKKRGGSKEKVVSR